MATFTELQTELAELKVARSKVLAGQSYCDVAGNSVTRVDLATLDRMIRDKEVQEIRDLKYLSKRSPYHHINV